MDDKKLAKIKELIEQGQKDDKYVNLDTMRLIKTVNLSKRKPQPKYIDDTWHIFADDELFFDVLQALQPDKKIRQIKPDPKGKQIDDSKDYKPSQNNNSTTNNNDNTADRKNDSSKKKTRPKSVRPNIPKNIRIEVWENEHGKQCYIGWCYCCRQELEVNDFEAGHIKPYFHGGADQVENLKPICNSCNISMTTLHMYEYMIRYNKAGRKDLPINRSYIFFNGLVQSSNEAITKIEKLLQEGKIGQTKADKYCNSIRSSRLEIDERLKILDEIRNL